MQKAKSFKWLWLVAAVFVLHSVAHAQPVLGQVIDQTKQLKQRQLTPAGAAKAALEEAPPPPPPPPPLLWSITGINNQLTAEIWQGDDMYRLPLQKGAKLPSGWQVVSADKQSVTLKLGKQTRKLWAAAKGSTGWEFPQAPRTTAAASAVSMSNPSARAAATALPPAALPAGVAPPGSGVGPR